MANISLCQEIKNFKNGDKKAFEKIVIKMRPIIRKYSKNLFLVDQEDAEQELALSLYCAIQSIQDISNEGKCITFLSNSLYYCFCALYRESKKQYIHEISKDYPSSIIVDKRTPFSTFSEVKADLLWALEKEQNVKHQKIVIMSFIYQYTDTEISQALGISRQYVNRFKKIFRNKYLV